MGISVTGVEPGNTTVTINSKTSPNISKQVPVTVKSRNLLAYGTAEGNGLTATVNSDGSLHVTGTATSQWRGLSWTFPCPVQGTVILRNPTSIAGLYPSVKFIDAEGHQLEGQVTSGSNAVAIPAGTVSLRFEILSSEATPTAKDGDLRVQLESGDTAHEWMRPDNTSLRGGCELANLWPEYQARTSFGITLTPLGNGEYKLAGTCSQSFNIETTRELEAGTYLAPQCQIDSYDTYVEIRDSTGKNLWRGYQRDTEIAVPKAGTYKFMIRFSPGKTVDATFTPRLYKLD
ncbi:hypothetical protein [Bifidobacterium longum]|uniref:hypothetical protein n=1 Tax=Bifidobacterium longum TaxID=216816 RepID=UPI00216247AD|nr:hypothetical protein [Bifidobacterium longum]